MRLVYRETGGIAGLRKVVEIDAADLPEDAAAELRALTAAAGPEGDTMSEAAAGPARDREAATLWLIGDDGQWHRLASASRPFPEPCRRLFGHLSAHARYEPVRR